MEEEYIVGIGMTGLGKFVDQSVKDLSKQSVNLALADAGIELNKIEAAWFSNTRQALLEGQNTIRGQLVDGSLLGTGLTFNNAALIEQAMLG